jgi:Bacterial Ig-like domain (group 3)/FG-GAP-like repeat
MLKRTILGTAVYGLMTVLAAAQATQFLQAPQYPTGVNPHAVAEGDFNNDGIPDIAVTNSGSNTITIMLGTGSGTFTAVNCSNCVTDNSPQGIGVGDFNQDGNLDIAVANSGSGTVSVYLGNGNGTFQAKTDLTTGGSPQGIVVGEFSGNSYPDIAVANPGNGMLQIFNNNNGTLPTTPTQTLNAGNNPWAITAGKLNYTDANPALFVSDYGPIDQVLVFPANGNGTFQSGLPITTVGAPIAIAVGYFNGTGSPLGVAIANVAGGSNPGNSVSVFTGNGLGGFTNSGTYTTANFPTGVAVGDFNGDGTLDLAVSAANGNVVTVLWGAGNGTFEGQINCGTGDIPYAILASSLTNNGVDDLVVANFQGNSMSVIMSNGNQTFQSRLDYNAGTNPKAVAVADFNGDGIPDLALADSNCPNYPNCGVSQISILLGNGNGSFQGPRYSSTGTDTDPKFIAVADFNGDGIPDLAVANYATGTVSVMLGIGNGTFQTHVDYPVGTTGVDTSSEPTSIAIGNFNGKYPDIVVTNYYDNTISVLLNNGNNSGGSPGTFATAANYNVGHGPISVAVVDLNGNQVPDLVVINESDNDATVLFGNVNSVTGQPNGTFTAQTATTQVGGNPQSVVVQDFNNDGIPDLAVADFLTQQVSILLGNGNGTFQNAVTYAVGASPSAIAIGDFNGDGIPDLAVTSLPSASSPGNMVSLLLGKGNGTFSAPALFGAGYFSYSLAVGDFNGDGALDVAVANGNGNTASILLNTQGTKMTLQSSAPQPTYGQSITLTTAIAVSVPTGLPAPTGNVTFMNGSAIIGTAQTLNNGAASVSTSTLPAGSNSLTALYSGDSNYQSHTVTLTQTVQKATSTTSLTSSLSTAIPGETVTFTATVNASQATGTVTFLDGTTTIGSGTLSGGQATLSTSALAMGTHNITASYAGTSNIAGSTSSVLQQIIGKASTTVVLTSNPNTANLNQNVAFTATVSGAGGVPTGMITFFNGTTQLGTSNLSGSAVAAFSTSSLPSGTDNITASYAGDSNFLSSTSSVLGLAVTGPGFTITSTALTPGSVSPGSSATSTVTITAAGGLSLSAVNLTCAVAPSASPAATCSVGSISTSSSTSGKAMLTFKSSGSQAALEMPVNGLPGNREPNRLFAFGLIVPAILLGGAGFTKTGRKRLGHLCLLLALAGCMAHVACGGGSSGTITTTPSGNSGTPAGQYTVTVTGTATGVQNPPQPLSMPVTVQ